jgi:hypothetical protein
MTAQLFVCLDRVMNDTASSVASEYVSVAPQSNRSSPSLRTDGISPAVFHFAASRNAWLVKV